MIGKSGGVAAASIVLETSRTLIGDATVSFGDCHTAFFIFAFVTLGATLLGARCHAMPAQSSAATVLPANARRRVKRERGKAATHPPRDKSQPMYHARQVA